MNTEEAAAAAADPRSPYACTNCGADPANWYTDPDRCNPWKCLTAGCGTWNDIPPALLASRAPGTGFDGQPLAIPGGAMK
jgi:hypothetical protein